MICFGDSITANGKWVNAHEANRSWKLVNAGRSGRQTSDIPTELPVALAANPDAKGLLILLGINDLPARNTLSDNKKIEACLANLQIAIDLALKQFPREAIFLVVPCGVDVESLDKVNLAKGYDITPPLIERLAIGIDKIATENGVQYLDLSTILRPGHFLDGLHPNAEGDAAIARAVGKALSESVTLNKKLPSFYLVGDSISIDYHEALQRECQGRYLYSRKGGLELAREDLDHPQGANGGDSNAVLQHLHEGLQNPAAFPATIIVNCGLHDIKTAPGSNKHQVPLETYRANLTAIINLLNSCGKRLIWITTTPIDEQHHNARSGFHRHESALATYNAAAREIMDTNGVPVIDLHAFTASLPKPHFRDHVHFQKEISHRQATHIRSSLDKLIS